MALILIVDDEPDVLAAMKASLEDASYTVMQASDGRQGIQMASENMPELIFLDLNMPRVDGFETLNALKADERTKEIPVVIVSAKGRPEDRLRTRAMGASDYINKPWADGELVLRAGLALMAAARKQGTSGGRATGLQARITQAMKPPPPQPRVITITQPTIVYQQAPAAVTAPPARPVALSPLPSSVNGTALKEDPELAIDPATVRDATRLPAARFIVQHEYSANQTAAPVRPQAKAAIILRPFEDPDWIIRFDTFDNPATAAQAPGDPYRFVYGIRGPSKLGANIAIFAEWELTDPANCVRFESNRTALFEIHRRQFAGLVSEWLLKRMDDSPRYTVLALFGDDDTAVRFRAFSPPPPFGIPQMQANLGATELFGQCACRVRRPGQP